MKRKLVTVFLATAVVATIAACGSSNDPEPAAPGEPDKVTVGVIPIVDVAPIYLGKEKGFFSKRNIDLTLQPAQGGAAIVPAVVSGQYQFGFSNTISMLLAQSQNVPIKVVSNGANATSDAQNDFSGLVVKDAAITSPKQLEGKKVATNTLKNIVDTSVKALVKADGGDPAKVDFVEMPFPDMVAALDGDRVDAIFVVEPFLAAAKAKGWNVIGSFAGVEPNLCIAVYFTSNQLAASNPDLVSRFTEAMNESLEYANSNPDDVRAVLGSYTQIPEQARAGLTLPAFGKDINRASLQKLGDLTVEHGLLQSAPDLTKLLP